MVPREPAAALAVRRFERGVDTAWRRTSYSGLIRAEEQSTVPGVGSEPEIEGTVDEEGEAATDEGSVVSTGSTDAADVDGADTDSADLPSPMNDLPAGATFGSLVHGVLEHTDPQSPDFEAELAAKIEEQRVGGGRSRRPPRSWCRPCCRCS